MSHQNPKRKQKPLAEWISRAIVIILGLVAILLGLAAVGHGYWWIRNYDAQLGVIGTGPTLGFVFMGALFIILGLVPWRQPPKEHKSKDDLYKVP